MAKLDNREEAEEAHRRRKMGHDPIIDNPVVKGVGAAVEGLMDSPAGGVIDFMMPGMIRRHGQKGRPDQQLIEEGRRQSDAYARRLHDARQRELRGQTGQQTREGFPPADDRDRRDHPLYEAGLLESMSQAMFGDHSLRQANMYYTGPPVQGKPIRPLPPTRYAGGHYAQWPQ